MQMYLSMIQNGSANAVVYGVAGFVVFCLLLCLLMVSGYRKKISKLKGDLVLAKTAQEQLLASEGRIQQLEGEFLEYKTQVGQYTTQAISFLEAAGNGLASDSDQDVDMDNLENLWKKQEHVVTQLLDRINGLQRSVQDYQIQLEELHRMVGEQSDLQTATENRLANVQIKNRDYKARIGGLELARMKEFNDLNLSAKEIRRLNEALACKSDYDEIKGSLLKLKEKNRAYKVQIEKLELDRMKVFNDLNLAVLKNKASEANLADKTDYVADVIKPLVVEEPPAEPIQVEAPTVTGLKDVSLTTGTPNGPTGLFTKWINSIKTDFSPGEKVSPQFVSSESKQANEEKTLGNLPIEALGPPGLEEKAQSILELQPAQKSDPASLQDKSHWFNSVKKQFGKIQPSPRQTVQADKGQIVVAEENSNQIPRQLKDFYQKMTSFNAKQ
ncbi:MAG: hypothetical protein CTY16_10920 [Methylobacter sp.]|nr:MAG: hypothetical protein CTY16_10920 [Methylobacter sp.]